jgi:hypothetical protein
VGDDIIRSDIEEKASDMEKKEFRANLKGRTTSKRLADSNEKHTMSEETAHFMYMLKHWPKWNVAGQS